MNRIENLMFTAEIRLGKLLEVPRIFLVMVG